MVSQEGGLGYGQGRGDVPEDLPLQTTGVIARVRQSILPGARRRELYARQHSQGLRQTEPSIASCVEFWFDAAQLDLGCTVHHFELDKTNTSLGISLQTSTVTLPVDRFIVRRGHLV